MCKHFPNFFQKKIGPEKLRSRLKQLTLKLTKLYEPRKKCMSKIH